jgi:hypothetical protein
VSRGRVIRYTGSSIDVDAEFGAHHLLTLFALLQWSAVALHHENLWVHSINTRCAAPLV